MNTYILFFAVIAVTVGNIAASCPFGYMYKIDCNICTCQQNGSYECTQKNCYHSVQIGKSYTVNYSCTPGQVATQSCETCACANDGKHMTCTRKTCQVEQLCQYGRTYQRNCNVCTCTSNGLYSCTHNICRGNQRA